MTTQTFHPPTATDAPPLSLPSDTEVVLAEETQSGWSNIYRGTVATTGQDTTLLDKAMPMWLMQYLLTNKIPIVPSIKVSFGVAAWSGKTSSSDSSADAANPYVFFLSYFSLFVKSIFCFHRRSSRLTANRHLRVRKILAYVCLELLCYLPFSAYLTVCTTTQVQDKIDRTPSRAGSRSGSISGGTPRSSVDDHRVIRSGSASSPSHTPYSSSPPSHMSDVEALKRPRPEDVYELLCNDVVLPLNMTLATIRHYVWRSTAELLLYYRMKV